MFKNRKILFILVMLITFSIIPFALSGCSKTEDSATISEEDKVGEIAMVIDSNLEKVEEAENEQAKNFQRPMEPKIGEIAYVRNIYDDFAYVVLLRPMEPQGVDSVGYIPLDNLRFDYTPEDMEENSIYCHIINDDTPIYDGPDGNQIGTAISEYTMVEERQGNWVLVAQKGGAKSGWVNSENIDYDFSKFIDGVKNEEYEFEKQVQ